MRIYVEVKIFAAFEVFAFDNVEIMIFANVEVFVADNKNLC